MSLKIGLCAMLFCAAPAFAQEAEEEERPIQGSNRFFFDAPESDEQLDGTAFDGSFTSTTMFFKETGGAVTMGAAQVETASPISRLYTDLRSQFDADHIGGGRWDFHSDLRGRFVSGSCRDIRVDSTLINPCTRFQSGVFSGHELDARELYVRRGGDTVDWTFGRQYVLDIAATKIDGVRYERGSGDWKLIAFGGGAPSRISRDIRDDYPEIPALMGMTGATRAFQAAVGGGAGYRYEQAWGAFGAASILPISSQQDGTKEDPRTFLTANGYWRVVSNFDVYHYIVFDVTGEGGVGLTNLNVGANFRPSPHFRTYLQATRVDTETLNIIAQHRLDNPSGALPAVQNNIDVTRIAAESLRGGVSTSFMDNRLELATTVTMRRRPEIALVNRQGMAAVTIAAAEASDVSLQIIDRKSLLGTRLGGTITRTFGGTPFGIAGGKRSADRSESLLFQVDATRSFRDGRAEIETFVNFIQSNDETRGLMCAPPDLESCYGSSAVKTIGFGGVLFFRFADDWFVMAGVNAALQKLTAVDMNNALVVQPDIIMTTAFGRLAYKF